MERTESKMEDPDEDEKDTTKQDQTSVDRKKPHAKREQKTNEVVQINEKFDMKEIMSKFVERMLSIMLTPEGMLQS